MKITILEHSPYDTYVFYEATIKNPKHAIQNYLIENNLDPSDITFDGGDTICEEHGVRAYEVEVQP